MFPRLTIFVFITAVLAFFIDRESARGTLDGWERGYLSWLAGNSKRLPEKTNIVHLTLENDNDDGSPGIFDQWPPGAIDYALILENLAVYSPRSVVVEPVLHWADGSEFTATILAEKSSELPALTLACTLQNDSTIPPQNSPPSVPPPIIPKTISGSVDAVPEFTATLVSPAPGLLSRKNITAGFVSIDLGAAGTVQDKVQLIARNGQSIVPSLALSGLIAYFAADTEEIEIFIGSHIQLTGTVRIPIDRTGALTLPPRSAGEIDVVPADELFLDADSREIAGLTKDENSLEKIRDSLVVVSFVDPGSPSTLAATIATVQSAHYPTEIRREYQQAIWAALAVFGAVVVARSRKSSFLAFVIAVAYTSTCLLVFATRMLWWPSAIPLAIIMTTVLLGQLLPRPGTPSATPS
ncbi:MAG: hypothetical protein P8J87_10390 [Verrucomicrobiales bacterium]|nr:hypothetical protein [Verrucomicrobiales bacterium]